LLQPERFRKPTGPRDHVLERNDIVLRDISSQYTTFRQADWQSVIGASGSGIVDETVCAEPANPIELLAGFQVPFGDRHDFTDRSGERGDGRVTMDDRPAEGRGDLDVR
jgi:hypothetical protein